MCRYESQLYHNFPTKPCQHKSNKRKPCLNHFDSCNRLLSIRFAPNLTQIELSCHDYSELEVIAQHISFAFGNVYRREEYSFHGGVTICYRGFARTNGPTGRFLSQLDVRRRRGGASSDQWGGAGRRAHLWRAGPLIPHAMRSTSAMGASSWTTDHYGMRCHPITSMAWPCHSGIPISANHYKFVLFLFFF